MGSYKKKLFIVLLLFSLISFFVCSSSFATTYYQESSTYNVEVINMLENNQEKLAYQFLQKFSQYATDEQKQTFKELFDITNYFTYFTFSNNGIVRLYLVPNNINWGGLSTSNINTTDEFFADTYIDYPITGYNIGPSDMPSGRYLRSYALNLTNNSIFYYQNYNAQIFMPTFLIFYNNQMVINYMNGISPNESALTMIIQSINENTEEQEEQTEEMKKLNSFMSSEDVDDDAYDMPTDNPTTDITESGVNGIFTMFYDKINNWESENITIRIPFANKIFIIPSDLTENIVNSYLPNTTTFGRLFGLIWYYLLGVYIVKDIQKYIDGLQTGEILTKSDTNIKTEML